MIAKLIWTDAIRQRPAIRARTSRSASSPDSPPKRLTSSGARPIVLPSRMPDTDSDSSTSVDMSASRLWRTDWILRRSSPTRRVSQTKNGSSTSENAARRQSSRNIATTVAATVVTFWTIDVAVEVTTLSTPPMSLAIRDCTSPVRVRVKNASDIRCRCAYTAARRSEEHTSELQSPDHLVCRLLLEQKKKKKYNTTLRKKKKKHKISI